MANTRLIYLAGPIDALADGGKGWRAEVAALFNAAGLNCFNPSGAFQVSKPWNGNEPWTPGICHAIRTINRNALKQCDGCFVYLPDNARAFGTIREIEQAVQWMIPTVVVSPWLKEHIDAYDVEVYSGFDEAVECLVHAI
ncbi:MAG TPA: hypothetical protein VFK94_06505 [Patescibacteria group bacterium]|nr:hypothetical protein [Patescibacteria group bacterium]